MPNESEIVAAMDADAEGAKLAALTRGAFELTGRDDLKFLIVEPFGGKDWNQLLQQRQHAPARAVVRLSALDAG
jgi:hypothetical protein